MAQKENPSFEFPNQVSPRYVNPCYFSFSTTNGIVLLNSLVYCVQVGLMLREMAYLLSWASSWLIRTVPTPNYSTI